MMGINVDGPTYMIAPACTEMLAAGRLEDYAGTLVNKVVTQSHTKRVYLALRVEPGRTVDTVITKDDDWYKR